MQTPNGVLVLGYQLRRVGWTHAVESGSWLQLLPNHSNLALTLRHRMKNTCLRRRWYGRSKFCRSHIRLLYVFAVSSDSRPVISLGRFPKRQRRTGRTSDAERTIWEFASYWAQRGRRRTFVCRSVLL